MAQIYKQSAGARRRCCDSLEGLIDPVLFRALGDPNRVALLVRLSRRNEPTRVTEAADCCPVDLSVVSRHLAVLRDAGVIRASRQGREVRYTVSPDLARSLRALADALDACCPSPDSPAEAKEGTP